jgi:hypothetical protein
MDTLTSACPLNRRQLVDEYFIENRAKILDIAAFLDRLDRAENADPTEDFRVEAFRRALEVLNSPQPSRVLGIHMIFSDPTTEPKAKLDQKAARGAYLPPQA